MFPEERPRPAESDDPRDGYESPVIVDLGTLVDLTLSGSSPLSDMWGGAAGGGS
jgi:hypothetical protein